MATYEHTMCEPDGSHIVVEGARYEVRGIGLCQYWFVSVVLDWCPTTGGTSTPLPTADVRVVGRRWGAFNVASLSGGPERHCRPLYIGIVRSMAPVWASDLTAGSIAILRKPQRAVADRFSSHIARSFMRRSAYWLDPRPGILVLVAECWDSPSRPIIAGLTTIEAI